MKDVPVLRKQVGIPRPLRFLPILSFYDTKTSISPKIHSSVLKLDLPHITGQLLLPCKQREKEHVSSVRSQFLIYTSVVFAYSWRNGKTLLQQETSCLLPIWEDKSIAKLADNMQQDGGMGKRIPSEVQSIHRRPSSWAALMQIWNSRRKKAGCFPWKAIVNTLGLASVSGGLTSVKILAKAYLSETFQRLEQASKVSFVL